MNPPSRNQLSRILLGLAASAGIGCAIAALAPADAGKHSDQAPVLVIWHNPGNSINSDRGLELAIWEDGGMLFSAGGSCSPGKYLLAGNCEPSDVRELLNAVHATGFADLQRDWVVPCSSSTTIVVRSQSRVTRRTWHENLRPGFGGDINDDADYRKFISSWKRVRGAAASVAPKEVHAIAADAAGEVYRGYNITEPYRTKWWRE
ncbi:MAG: hypothetical protein SF069_09795 [Phycisphaerae bacterium]|nr:hypothetical protein [Phycisphaerae bacterium]